jgi:hypothetical protein
MQWTQVLAEPFKLDIVVASNDRCKEIRLTLSAERGKQERNVLLWNRKRDLADNVYVEEWQSGELRVVKRVVQRDKTKSSELAVIGTITTATEYVSF